MAMNGPFADDFWKACKTELETVTDDMDAWDVLSDKYPDGAVKKFKACFCAQGDRQQHGINYWETWSPIVHWSAIQTVMILAAKERDGNKTILSQPGLIKRDVKGLRLSTKFTSSLPTPTEQAPLPGDLDGEPPTGCFNYASIVGMLHYLNHTRPDCAFAIHQCARYSFKPRRSHEAAVKCIGPYLKGTMTNGLVLDPSDNLTIDCYPDADFAGIWEHEHPQDPHCNRS
ncbi:hypothetical protein ACHAWF_005516 [Thalassiosira exigua]